MATRGRVDCIIHQRLSISRTTVITFRVRSNMEATSIRKEEDKHSRRRLCFQRASVFLVSSFFPLLCDSGIGRFIAEASHQNQLVPFRHHVRTGFVAILTKRTRDCAITTADGTKRNGPMTVALRKGGPRKLQQRTPPLNEHYEPYRPFISLRRPAILPRIRCPRTSSPTAVRSEAQNPLPALIASFFHFFSSFSLFFSSSSYRKSLARPDQGTISNGTMEV